MKQGWQIYKLEDICTIYDKLRKPISKKDRVSGIYPYYGASCVQDYVNDYLFDGRYVLIGEDGAKWGSGEDTAYIVEGKFWVNNHAHIIQCNNGIVDTFIYYYFNHLDLTKLVAGAIIPKLTQETLRSMEIPIPPLSEQQRIVALLDAEFAKIDALKANAEKNLQNAKDLFQAALKMELEPKEGWKKKTIKDVCSIFGRIGYRGYTRNDLVDNAVDGAITLSPSNIVDNEMVYDKVTYISWFKYEESPEIMIFDDDILLVKTGSSYGKCALVRNLPHKATINPQFVVLKNININRGFLNYFLRTPYTKARFDEFVSGTAIPTFSQANLGNMAITFPSIEDQQSIVARLNALNEKCKTLQANYEKTLSLCDDLKQALLRKAFNGEI